MICPNIFARSYGVDGLYYCVIMRRGLITSGYVFAVELRRQDGGGSGSGSGSVAVVAVAVAQSLEGRGRGVR